MPKSRTTAARRLALAALLVCQVTPASADPTPGLGDGTSFAPAVTHKNLTLIPLVTSDAPDPAEEEVSTLDEGMRAKKVKIKEVDQSGSVGTLSIQNNTGKPLFLMAGEVVLGGKQDRIVGKNTLIPKGAKQNIPVFCVEHGRWSAGRKVDFETAGVLAHKKLRTKASFKNQGEVWQEVSEKNAKRGASNATDTYRQVAAQQAGGTLASWEKAINGSLAAMPAAQRDKMVGVAVAVNGKVVAVDVFGNPKLYAKLEQKLLRSYITEAIDAPLVPGVKPPGGADVKGFLELAKAAPEPEVRAYESDDSETVEKVGKDAGSTKVIRKGAPGKAKPVYESIQTME
jgi:hypothetical protein